MTFVDEPDQLTNDLGVKGLGEIGIVGTGAAVPTRFPCHSVRVRSLPITVDKIVGSAAFEKA